LSGPSKETAKKVADDFFLKNFPNAKKILIIPESHTRNLRYLNNVLQLQEILGAKREVLTASLLPEITQKTEIDLENGSSFSLYPISIINEFKPDVIVLNNDLTDGIPEVLQNLNLPIIPSTQMGWHKRNKSQHFTIYNELAKELAALIDIDPWLISTLHDTCTDLDFKEEKGLNRLALQVDELLKNLKNKYQKYGIEDEPYCYVKADNGTYGMAVWPVFSGQEILEINKKERNKMNTIKGSVQNTHVLIQEGVKTIDKIYGKIAEPMIYMINGQVVGNLFRVNESRDEKISLNAMGASFFDLENLEENQINLGAPKTPIIEVYSLISRLAALAAAMENQKNV
jgi:glutamate--cysteine ligase